MAAVGTAVTKKLVNERGFKLWDVELIIPTELAGVSKQSQNIGLDGFLKSLHILAPNLATDTTFNISIFDKDAKLIAKLADIADNSSTLMSAMELIIYTGAMMIAGDGIPIFADDYIVIDFTTAQAGGSLDFDIDLRGT